MKILTGIVLIILGIEDLRTQKLPLRLLLALLLVACIYGVCNIPISQCFLGALPGLFLLLLAFLQTEIIGVGDGLISVAYGMVFGWRDTCIWLMYSFFLVAIVGIFLKVFQKKRVVRLPFVPFMALVHVGMSL